MNRISRRQFLFLALSSLGSAAVAAVPNVPRVETGRVNQPQTQQQPLRAYGAESYGQGAYGEVSAHLPRISR